MRTLITETAGRLPEVYYYSEQFLADGVKRKLQSLRFIIDAIETPDRISVGPKARRFTRSSKNSIKRQSYLARAKSGAGLRFKTSSIDSKTSTSSSKGVSMNLDSLFTWVVGIVVAVAFTGNLDRLQMAIWKAEAAVIRESRTSNWGSPRFFVPDQSTSAMSRTVHAINHKRK